MFKLRSNFAIILTIIEKIFFEILKDYNYAFLKTFLKFDGKIRFNYFSKRLLKGKKSAGMILIRLQSEYNVCSRFYHKVPKFSDARKHCRNLPKIQEKRQNLKPLSHWDLLSLRWVCESIRQTVANCRETFPWYRKVLACNAKSS